MGTPTGARLRLYGRPQAHPRQKSPQRQCYPRFLAGLRQPPGLAPMSLVLSGRTRWCATTQLTRRLWRRRASCVADTKGLRFRASSRSQENVERVTTPGRTEDNPAVGTEAGSRDPSKSKGDLLHRGHLRPFRPRDEEGRPRSCERGQNRRKWPGKASPAEALVATTAFVAPGGVEPVGARTSSRLKARSRADWKRRAGSFSRQR